MSTKQLHRKVRRDLEHGDLRGFRTKSFTPGVKAEYHPVIDVVTLEFQCSCPDHVYRHRFCKHLQRAAANLIRHGELAPTFFQSQGVKCCHLCGNADELERLCNDNYQTIDGQFICRPCIKGLNPND